MRRVSLSHAVIVFAVGLVAASCGAASPSSDAGATTTLTPTTSEATTTTTTLDVVITAAPPPKSEQPGPTVPLPSVPPGADPYDNDDIVFAVADLAAMLGVPGDDIKVVGWEEALWRDGSIGCALPGMSYTQALVDGMRIALELDGEVYWYHQGGGRDSFYCANPTQ